MKNKTQTAKRFSLNPSDFALLKSGFFWENLEKKDKEIRM